jgi:hypothetical protein
MMQAYLREGLSETAAFSLFCASSAAHPQLPDCLWT